MITRMICLLQQKKTLEYQETMNLDIENIASLKKNWRPIYEVIENSYFEATKLFPKTNQTYVERIQMKIRTYQMKEEYFL